MFGFSAFAVLPFATVPIVTVNPVIFDFHDGGFGKRKKKEEEQRKAEAAKAKARRNEVLELFERIVEGKPELAEEIAEPFVIKQATKQAPAVIDYDAMLASFDRVEQIYNAYIEMDDEDVLLLL
jgi:tRNA 2-selenouridine synthase SelU